MLAAILGVSRQTAWNWKHKDRERWALRMRHMLGGAPLGAPVEYPTRGRRLSSDDWRFVASMRGRFPSMSCRRLCGRIEQEVGHRADKQHLRGLSHATIWRNRYYIQGLVAEMAAEPVNPVAQG